MSRRAYMPGAPHRPAGTRWWCNTAVYPMSGWCDDCTNSAVPGKNLCRSCQKRRGQAYRDHR